MIVVCVLFVAGIVVVGLLAFVIDRGVHHLTSGFDAEQKVENETGIVSNPLGFDSSHPPQKDVYQRPLTCSADSTSGQVTAKGSVFNHTGQASSYLVSVSFTGKSGDPAAVATDLQRGPGPARWTSRLRGRYRRASSTAR